MKAVGWKTQPGTDQEPETETDGPPPLPESKECFRNLFNCFYALGMQAPDGSLPTRSSTWRRVYRCFSAVMYVWQLILVPTFFVISYRYIEGMEMTQILTSIQVAIDAVILPAKIVALAWNLSLLRKAEYYLAQLDGRCRDDEEFHVIDEAGGKVLQLAGLVLPDLLCHLLHIDVPVLLPARSAAVCPVPAGPRLEPLQAAVQHPGLARVAHHELDVPPPSQRRCLRRHLPVRGAGSSPTPGQESSTDGKWGSPGQLSG